MAKIKPSMRLKVKRDTFFLPDPNSGVYFRNNVSSFHMKGNMIDLWVTKLLPMFNGEYSLENLTNGLSAPYRKRVYEIAEVLYQNGFVRDVSQDLPHQLSEVVLKKYASQIEFLESFGESAAYRFQVYRQAEVLAIGSGPFLISLVLGLIESGLSKLNVVITDSAPTNMQRLEEIILTARKKDPGLSVEEIIIKKEQNRSWRELIQAFDSILYVGQKEDIEELRTLHKICREEKKQYLPALLLERVGLAGPLVHPDSEGCWESAWRSIHHTVFDQNEQLLSFSSTAGTMLANVMVFELFKKITSLTESEQRNQFFLLNLETLEGNWHSFLPHPLVAKHPRVQWIEDMDLQLKQGSTREGSSRLLLYITHLTSVESGVFHILGEEDLKQLPLAQCRVQVVDPLSEGPSELLPSIYCSELTSEKVRREAGLTGIEVYVSRMVDVLIRTLPTKGGSVKSGEFVGVGAGETFAEGVCRGLQKCLTKELRKQLENPKYVISRVQLNEIEDDSCRYYLQALTTMQGVPIIGLGQEVAGFPVVWVGSNEQWYVSVDLNPTKALQKALQQAIVNEENNMIQKLDDSLVVLEDEKQQSMFIRSSEEIPPSEVLISAMQVLEKNGKRLLAFEFELEPVLNKELLRVYGILLREEASQ